MEESRRRMRILAKVMLAASVIACAFGCYLILECIHEFAVLSGEGSPHREEVAPVIAELAEGVVLAVHYFFVSKFFLHSIQHGVPFTHEGAKEIKILGYETIFLPIIAWIVAVIAFSGIRPAAMISGMSIYEVVLGFALIITSYVIEYGTIKIEKATRGHKELLYIAEHDPEVLKRARIALFGTDIKEEE